MKSRKKFTKEFKQTAVRRLEGGQSVAEVARALEVHPSDLHRWRRELEQHGERAFSGVGQKRAEGDAEDRVGMAQLWKPADHPGTLGQLALGMQTERRGRVRQIGRRRAAEPPTGSARFSASG